MKPGEIELVLGLALDDFMFLDDERDTDGRYERFARELSPTEIRELADHMNEWFYDSEQWNMALESGIKKIEQHRSET